MSEKTMKENLQSFAAKQILHYLDEDPEKSLPKLLEWADKFDKDNTLPSQRRVFHNILENPDNNWYKLIMSLWSDIDPAVRMTFFENFIVNASLIGYGRQEKAAAEHNCNIPWAILMDPTSACNLHCTGCWAAEYGNKLNLTFETMDNIIRQGKELGTYMYIFSGGEPMVRKDDIIRWGEFYDRMQSVRVTVPEAYTSNYYVAARLYYGNVQRRDVLWPIPTYELSVNPYLVQNKGW